MSKIPEDIKQKIEDNYFFVDEEDFDDSLMDYDDYVKERMALQRAATYGYSLSLERIGELEKEVAELRAFLDKAHWHGWFCGERYQGPDRHGYEDKLPANWSEMDYEEHQEWFFQQFKTANKL